MFSVGVCWVLLGYVICVCFKGEEGIVQFLHNTGFARFPKELLQSSSPYLMTGIGTLGLRTKVGRGLEGLLRGVSSRTPSDPVEEGFPGSHDTT